VPSCCGYSDLPPVLTRRRIRTGTVGSGAGHRRAGQSSDRPFGFYRGAGLDASGGGTAGSGATGGLGRGSSAGTGLRLCGARIRGTGDGGKGPGLDGPGNRGPAPCPFRSGRGVPLLRTGEARGSPGGSGPKAGLVGGSAAGRGPGMDSSELCGVAASGAAAAGREFALGGNGNAW